MAEQKLAPCPACGEEIIATALKCRFCNERFDTGPFMRAKVRWVGNKVVVHTRAKVPSTPCWVCARDDGSVVKREKNFSWVPSWAYLGYLAGVLVGVILVAVMRQTRKLAIPLCNECASRWTLATVGYFGFAIVGFFGVPALFAIAGNAIARENGLFVGIALGIVAWIAGLIIIVFAVLPRLQATCDNIDGDQVFLKLPRIELVRAAREKGKAKVVEDDEA
jgi:hypothetical protein